LATLKSLLLDTGPVVALLARRDPYRQVTLAAWEAAHSFELHTSMAVVTEALHFLRPEADGPRLFGGFVRDAAVNVHGFSLSWVGSRPPST